MSISSSSVARQIYNCLLSNTLFPTSLSQTMSVEEAYDVQFALLELQAAGGQSHAGWKVGLTSPAMQVQQGVHEPCLGHLLKDRHLLSPARMTFDALSAPGFENELCFRMKAPLLGADITVEQAALAIGEVAPALEIIEKRGVFKDDIPLAVAGNVQQCAFVTGEFARFDPDLDLSAVWVEVFVNDKSRETASGAEVLGNPVQSIVWLVRKLAQRGFGLKPGDLIMSGSFTKQYTVECGDHIRAVFSDLGSAEVAFD